MAKRKPKPADSASPNQGESDGWHDALRKALGKKKPEGGWPKPSEKDKNETDEEHGP